MSCCKDEPVKVPDGYDVVYLLFGYDENNKFICTEADSDWSYDIRVRFATIPQRYAFLKKKLGKEALTPVTTLFIEDGKVFNTKEEAEGKKIKRNFFS